MVWGLKRQKGFCLVPQAVSLFLYSSKEIDERNDAPCAPVGVAAVRLVGVLRLPGSCRVAQDTGVPSEILSSHFAKASRDSVSFGFPLKLTLAPQRRGAQKGITRA